VAVANPAPHVEKSPPSAAGRKSNLALRIGSALVLAPLALAIAYIGGWLFALFWCVAGVGLFIEWCCLVEGRLDRPAVLIGGIALVIAAGLTVEGFLPTAVIVLVLGAASAAVVAPLQRQWIAAGVAYGGALVMAPIALRQDAEQGWPALLLLFAVVWATDIAGYFVGRIIGGAKLWPRVSPNKTWAGAIGGAIATMIAGTLFGLFTNKEVQVPIICIALLLSIASQGGDLFESAVKRRFGAKDAGRIIPGHGGLMDRLDGFVAAALVALLIGLLRGGTLAPARGLLLW
jgi:phosphatidate cytidylyltransferase